MRARDAQEERQALERLHTTIADMVEAAVPFWHWGDGYGGSVFEMISEAFDAKSLPRPPAKESSGRTAIPRPLRKAVFERDAYRCQMCGDHKDLHIDHVIPVVAGGLDEFDNLQTLCQTCNLRKGARLE